MGLFAELYDRHVLPTLLDFACGMKAINRQRQKVVPKATGQVLEIGIGTGLNMRHYNADKVEKIIGLDPAMQMHRLAKKRIQSTGLSVELMGLPAEKIPLPDASIDTIVMTYTLCTNPAELSESSVGLIFSFFPNIFMAMVPKLGYSGATIMASTFFLLAFVAAITSLVSIIEVPVAALKAEGKKTRNRALFLVIMGIAVGACLCALSFGQVNFLSEFAFYSGTNKSLFDVLVDVFYDTILPFNGLLICLLVVWKWKRHNMAAELSVNGHTGWLERYTHVALAFWIPLVLAGVFVITVMQKFFA